MPMMPGTMDAGALQALLTDPRATPQQRAAAVAALQAQGGGAGGMSGMEGLSGAGGGGQGAGGGSDGPDTADDAIAAYNPSQALSAGERAANGGGRSGVHDADADAGSFMGMDPKFAEMLRRDMQGGGGSELTSEDKSLALARFGFGMAASKSPHLGVAIGEGGVQGIQGLEAAGQQRALNRMKALSLYNSALGTQALIGQRGANVAATNQKVGLTEGGKLTRETAAPIVQHMLETGDFSDMSKTGVGLLGTYNKKIIYDMLAEENPDLANQALVYAQSLSEHKGYGNQLGQNAAGPSSFNPGSGQVLRGAPAPGPIATVGRPAPIVAPPMAPATAPEVAPPGVTPQATPALPAPAAVVAPKINPFDHIPAPTPMPQPTTTGMKAELDQRASDLGKLGATIDKSADAAKGMNFIYDNMNHARDHFVTGKGSTIWNEANAYLLQAANGINATLGDGTIDTKDMEGKVGNYQDFKKNGVNLIGSATRAVSPRASTQEMLFLAQGVPNNEMTDTGYDLIVNQLQGVNDFALAQQKAKQLYIQNPKNKSQTLDGFDSWFNQAVDPAVFMLHRMSPESAAAAINNIKRSNPQMAKKLVTQLSTAKNLGLFAEQ